MKPAKAISIGLVGLAVVYLAIRVSSGEMATVYVQPLDVGETPAQASDYIAGTAFPSPSRTVGVWVAALFTLFIFSFLYRDNVFYKFAESVVVGVSAAY